jgi:hypothetical protein
MSQYSNEFGSIIKQLRKISANTCAESEQMPYYEKEVCGTLPDVEGQTSQYTLIRIYTRDIDTGQIVLSHYEDILGNIINGTVVEACCDSAVCGPPYLCAANIVGLSVNEEGTVIIDMTGTTMTGYLQLSIGETVMGPMPNPGVTSLSVDIIEAFRTGETLITLSVGNNVDMDLYCSFSFVTLTDLNEDIKEDGDNPNWNPFPSLVDDLGCTGTLTYSMLYDSTGNGVTINSTTGDLTIPAGIYIEENSWVYVEVRCDGVLVAVAGLQLLNEAPGGFRLEWDDIANTPFATHTDLNTFINGNGGAANYTSVGVVGNVQTFYGGTAVDLGDSFMDANDNIVSIRDDAFQVVAQGRGCQKTCAILETVALPALITQDTSCQYSNLLLTSLNLQALTTQTSACQSFNDTLLSISLPSLTTQTDSNQSNNTLLTAITLPLLTTQVGAKNAGNQSSNPALLSLLLPSLTTQGAENQISNAALTTISLPLLTTQTSGNQNTNPLLTSLSMPALTTQTGGNQQSNASLVTLTLPSLITQENGNQLDNAAMTTISLPALTAQLSDNQGGNASLTTLSLPVLATQTHNNQSANSSLVTLTLPALTTQTHENQKNHAALTTFTANLLTSQTNDNLIGNSLLTTITTPLLTSIGTGNYAGGNYAAMTINVDASLFGAADILLAQAGGATII